MGEFHFFSIGSSCIILNIRLKVIIIQTIIKRHFSFYHQSSNILLTIVVQIPRHNTTRILRDITIYEIF